MSLSKTSFIGRLTKDPETKQIPVNGEQQTVANFSVAVDEDFGDQTDFYDVVAWRKTAENVARFLGKGRLVYVEGRLKIRSYTKNINGEEVTFKAPEIRADKVQFLDRGDSNTNPHSQANQSQPTQNTAAPF